MKPISYLQTDAKWKNVDYSAKGESTTIGKAGCGPTSAAMVIATLKDKSVTPVTTAKWSLANGYKACKQGTYHGYFIPQLKKYGIVCRQLNTSSIYKSTSSSAATLKATIISHLKQGGWIIACMGKGTWTSSGHYVLAYGLDQNGKVLINDPASTKAERICGDQATWLSEIKFAWAVVVPKEEDDMTEAEVKRIIKSEQKYIANISDAPADFQPVLKKLKAEGLMNGNGKEEVGMSYEAVRLLVINYRMINGK